MKAYGKGLTFIMLDLEENSYLLRIHCRSRCDCKNHWKCNICIFSTESECPVPLVSTPSLNSSPAHKVWTNPDLKNCRPQIRKKKTLP